MKRFLALFLAPPSVIEDWSKTDPDEREAAEEKMRNAWTVWKTAHEKMIGEMGAGGKTMRVASDGVSDTKNDIMMYAFIDADSHEEATKIFENHPHLQIPRSSIEVMSVRTMTGV